MKALRGYSPIVAALLLVTFPTPKASTATVTPGETSPRDSPRVTSANSAQSPPCQMSTADAAWFKNALRAWEVVRTRDLKLAPVEPPAIVAFDRNCAYAAPPFRPLKWKATAYDKAVTLPDSKQLPAGRPA